METKYHIKISVDGCLRQTDRELKGLVDINGSPATGHQARQWLKLQQHLGRKYVPVGDPCEGWSYETGCPGHAEREELPLAREVLTPADSQALTHQSEHYPARFTRRVPLRIRLLKTVTADPMPYPLCLNQDALALVIGQEVDVWVNSHGAVSACMADGKNLGLKPDEFEVIAWHPVRDTSQLGTNGGW